jgi:hypothetical protein
MLLSIFSMKRGSPSPWVVFALVNVAVCAHYLNVHFTQPFTMCWWSLLWAVLLLSEKLADRVVYCLTAFARFSTSPYWKWAVACCMTGAPPSLEHCNWCPTYCCAQHWIQAVSVFPLPYLTPSIMGTLCHGENGPSSTVMTCTATVGMF